MFILAAALVIVGLFIALCLFLLSGKTYPENMRSKGEETYFSSETNKRVKFPSLNDDPSVSLSVIIPAYFEESRLPPMLKESLEYLEKRTKTVAGFSYEVIVVNDGSSDKTAQISLDMSAKYGSNKIRLLDLETNRGKGGAVRMGVENARGELILFADADGATRFSDLDRLLASFDTALSTTQLKGKSWEFPCIICGSRAHMEEDAVATRSFFRTVLMYGFHFLVWFFTVRGIRDTQCGFKLFSRSAARMTFPSLHIERWAFDVELLYIAQTLGIPIREVPVNWTEIEGSKVTPFWSWLQMGRDLILIWLRYKIGAWKIIYKKQI